MTVSAKVIRASSAFKTSDAGVIPSDWEVRPVGAMGDVRAGKALAARGPGRLRPYLRTKNVFDGRIDIEDVLQMPMTDADFERYRLRYGDVLLNEGQSLELVGRCAMYKVEYPEPCAIQNQLVRFRANDGVSAAFCTHLFRYCQQTGVFAKIALQTTSVAHLGVSRFQSLQLAWPPDDSERRAIAEALDDADALVESLKRFVAKKRLIKQGAMQELLTGQRRLPGFDSKWEVKTLGSEIDGLDAGVSVNSDRDAIETGSDVASILKTSCVEAGRFLPWESKPISAKELQRATLTPRADTILISRMNTIDLVGESGYIESTHPKLFVPDRLWMTRFRKNASMSARWLGRVDCPGADPVRI